MTDLGLAAIIQNPIPLLLEAGEGQTWRLMITVDGAQKVFEGRRITVDGWTMDMVTSAIMPHTGGAKASGPLAPYNGHVAAADAPSPG